jgi:hypothetical protein
VDWGGFSAALVAAVAGAGVGAGATALATWWVSLRLSEDRDREGLLGAVGIVHAELSANRARLARELTRLESLLGAKQVELHAQIAARRSVRSLLPGRRH